MVAQAGDKYSKLGDMVSQMQNGNMDFFVPFYEETKKMVIFELKSAGVHENEVEDLSQEVYLKFVNGIRSIHDTKAAYKWLKQTSYRTGLNHVTSSVCRHEQLLAEDEEYQFETSDDYDAPIPMPEDFYVKRESQQMIRQILDELPQLQYQTIFAFYYNENSVKEIATMMQLPEGTVKTNLFRARNTIKSKVLELEKRQGIRLHAVGALPILLFLFDSEAMAMTIEGNMVAEADAILEKVGTSGFEAESRGMKADMRGKESSPAVDIVSGAATAGQNGGLSIAIKLLVAGIGIVVIGTASFLLYFHFSVKQTADPPIAEIAEAIPEDPTEKTTDVHEDSQEDVQAAQEAFTRIDEEEQADTGIVDEEGEKQESENQMKAEAEQEVEQDIENSVDNAGTIENSSSWEGEVCFLKNNQDGTFQCAYMQEAELEKSVVENANVGDVICSVAGKKYQVIEAQAVRDEEGDITSYLKRCGYYKTGVYLVDGEEYWDYYYLKENAKGNYALIYPDAGVAISEMGEEVTLGIADDAKMKMTCFEGDYDAEYLTTIPGCDFKKLSFLAGDYTTDTYYNQNRIYDFTSGFSGQAVIENGMITFFKETFRE